MRAIISPCGKFRNLLWRGPIGPQCAVVMLNPSWADSEHDDNTVKRIYGFAKDWGYESFVIANCYTFRSEKPEDLRFTPDPIGPHADSYLHAVSSCPLIVVAWGRHARPARVAEVEKILRSHGRPLFCLGTNEDGSPRHPLYLPYSQKLVEWRP